MTIKIIRIFMIYHASMQFITKIDTPPFNSLEIYINLIPWEPRGLILDPHDLILEARGVILEPQDVIFGPS